LSTFAPSAFVARTSQVIVQHVPGLTLGSVQRSTSTELAKAEAGDYPAKPPLGYVIRRETGPDGEPKQRDGKIEKTEWCDKLLLRMLELRLTGASFQRIADTVGARSAHGILARARREARGLPGNRGCHEG
jgi:hypothetical protein